MVRDNGASPAAARDSAGPEPKRQRLEPDPRAEPPQAHGLGRHGLIDRDSFIRLLQLSLSDLGHQRVAEALERASSVPTHVPEVVRVQKCIEEEDWEGAEGALAALAAVVPGASEAALVSIAVEQRLAMESGRDDMAALGCLRRLAALGATTEARLRTLAIAFVFHPGPEEQFELSSDVDDTTAGPEEQFELCSDVDDTTAAPIDRFHVGSGSYDLDDLREERTECRRSLATLALRAMLPPDVLLPHGRLEDLLEQAMTAQANRNGLNQYEFSSLRHTLLHDPDPKDIAPLWAEQAHFYRLLDACLVANEKYRKYRKQAGGSSSYI